MEKWIPKKVDAIDIAFGGKISDLMPKYQDIPEEFKRHSGTIWNDLVSDWFFRGMSNLDKLKSKTGIDRDDALRHIRSIMRSFEPKHEHKESGCAFLFSEWFEPITKEDLDSMVKKATK